MDSKILFTAALLLFLINVTIAEEDANQTGEILWYMGFGVGLIILAFVSETAYKVFSALYAGSAEAIPSSKIDHKEDLKRRRKIMGQMNLAEQQRVDDWETVQRSQVAKNLFRLMIYRNNIKLSEASKELGVDIVTLSRAVFDLKKKGMIEVSGERNNPNLKATKLLAKRVKGIPL